MNDVPLVDLRRVVKTYEEGGTTHLVLNGVDFQTRNGEFVVLLGRSGSGKSTLLNLISGIDLPTSGEVFIDGEPLSRLSERDRTLFRRRRIGFIFQFFNLIPTLNVLENLLLPLELNGRVGREHETSARELLRQVGLDRRANAFPDRLSGGEQQRVAVARALVHDPALLLADEPTGNLDADTGGHVLDLLTTLVRERGKTLITATHSLDAANRADRVLTIRDGRLVERGTEPAS